MATSAVSVARSSTTEQSRVLTDTYRFNGSTAASYDGSNAKFVLNGSDGHLLLTGTTLSHRHPKRRDV